MLIKPFYCLLVVVWKPKQKNKSNFKKQQQHMNTTTILDAVSFHNAPVITGPGLFQCPSVDPSMFYKQNLSFAVKKWYLLLLQNFVSTFFVLLAAVAAVWTAMVIQH